MPPEPDIRCCTRDNDNDGNCDIHARAGVLRTPNHLKGSSALLLEHLNDAPLSIFTVREYDYFNHLRLGTATHVNGPATRDWLWKKYTQMKGV